MELWRFRSYAGFGIRGHWKANSSYNNTTLSPLHRPAALNNGGLNV